MKSELKPKNSLLLVVDIQEKFRKVINEFSRVVGNSKKLIKAAKVLDIPMIMTEQYPEGLGKTVKEIKGELEKYDYAEKTSFDCFNDKNFVKLIGKKGKKNIIICGIEAHVCVFQTVLSALSAGYNLYIVTDAVSSRKKSDCDIALKRMQHEGAKLVSTEMIIFQMIENSKDEKFKKISEIVK